MIEKERYKIVIMVFDRFQCSALSGIREILELSNLLSESQKKSKALEVTIVSEDGLAVFNHFGQLLEVDSKASSIEKCDAIIFMGTMFLYEENLYKAFLSEETKQWMLKQSQKRVLMLSVNSGTFLLAEAGILQNKKFNLPSQYVSIFKKVYPSLSINNRNRNCLTRDDNIITSHSLTAWLDISLEIVYDFFGESQEKLIKKLLSPDNAGNFDTDVALRKNSNKFLKKIQILLSDPEYSNICVNQLANQMSVSERTLHRKVKEYADCTPKEFIDQNRIEKACKLLKYTDKQIKEIAILIGYSSDVVFSRVFLKKKGVCPTDYRKQLLDKQINC